MANSVPTEIRQIPPIGKNCSSTTTLYIFSGAKVVAEYDNGAAVASPTREYIYSGSAVVAKIDSSGTKYYHQDQLSNRVVTDSSGTVSAQLGHYPFGEAWYNATNDKFPFTSYERDAESGNDYAMARFDVHRLARFASPDLLAGSRTNPQSLNRYAYVHNDAVNKIDPAGTNPQSLSRFVPPYLRPPDGLGTIGAGGCGEFEAVEGIPGCYVSYTIGGTGFAVSYGFSEELYSQTMNFLDSLVNPGDIRPAYLPNYFRVTSTDLGVIQTTEGVIPEVEEASADIRVVIQLLPEEQKKVLKTQGLLDPSESGLLLETLINMNPLFEDMAQGNSTQMRQYQVYEEYWHAYTNNMNAIADKYFPGVIVFL